MRRTALRCSCSEPHGELQGSFNGINRTAMVARSPKRMCGCMVADFQQHLRTTYGNYGALIKTIREKEKQKFIGPVLVANMVVQNMSIVEFQENAAMHRRNQRLNRRYRLCLCQIQNHQVFQKMHLPRHQVIFLWYRRL